MNCSVDFTFLMCRIKFMRLQDVHQPVIAWQLVYGLILAPNMSKNSTRKHHHYYHQNDVCLHMIVMMHRISSFSIPKKHENRIINNWNEQQSSNDFIVYFIFAVRFLYLNRTNIAVNIACKWKYTKNKLFFYMCLLLPNLNLSHEINILILNGGRVRNEFITLFVLLEALSTNITAIFFIRK